MNKNRKDEMSVFLRQLFRNASSINFNQPLVYNLLSTYSLSDSQLEYKECKGLNIEFLYKAWQNHFFARKNIEVYNDKKNPFFLYFYSKKILKNKEFIKIYIPLKYAYIEEGVNKVFDFLDKEDIRHLSKVSSTVRSDSVTIRIAKNDIESLKKIYDFINNDSFFKNTLNDVNPFVPKYGPLGIMKEHGNSYNRDISFYIADYINNAKRSNQTSVSADDFYNYLKYCASYNICFDGKKEFDYTIFKTFQVAYYGYDIEKEYLKEEKSAVLSYEQKRAIFLKTIYSTYKEYNVKQVIGAIIEIIDKNDYNGLTSKGFSYDIRSFLKENVSKEDILSIIDNHLSNIKSDINKHDIKAKVSLFVNSLYKDELAYMFDEICDVTLSKHGSDALKNAIELFVKEGDTKHFSRFRDNSKENYRDKLSKFDRRYMSSLMETSLINKGVLVGNLDLDDLIELYVNELYKTYDLNLLN